MATVISAIAVSNTLCPQRAIKSNMINSSNNGASIHIQRTIVYQLAHHTAESARKNPFSHYLS